MSELKEVFAYQPDEIESLVGKANGNSYYLKSEADREIRKQKRKRCLAMARWCYDRWIHAYHLNKIEKTRFYVRWQKCWLKLAEQFKPNSTAQ